MAFEAVAVGARYDGAVRRAILCWKFGGRWTLRRLLIDMLEAAFVAAPWADHVNGFVPVPQPFSRWLKRRFHPAGQLATGLSERTGRPVWNILRAKRHKPQLGLSLSKRATNIKNVFWAVRDAELRNRVPCLVDDVMTTGATLNEAAQVLLAAGASKVYALTVARTP